MAQYQPAFAHQFLEKSILQPVRVALQQPGQIVHSQEASHANPQNQGFHLCGIQPFGGAGRFGFPLQFRPIIWLNNSFGPVLSCLMWGVPCLMWGVPPSYVGSPPPLMWGVPPLM